MVMQILEINYRLITCNRFLKIQDAKKGLEDRISRTLKFWGVSQEGDEWEKCNCLISLFHSFCIKVSQPWQWGHFEPHNSLLWWDVFYLIGCLTSSLAEGLYHLHSKNVSMFPDIARYPLGKVGAVKIAQSGESPL